MWGKVSATVLQCAREGWEQTGEGVSIYLFFLLKWLVSNVSVYCKPCVRLIVVSFLNNKKNQVNVALSEQTKCTSN